MNRAKQAQAAAATQLLAIIEELRSQAQVAQETNRTYKDFILAQSTQIEILQTNLKIRDLENQALKDQLAKRRK